MTNSIQQLLLSAITILSACLFFGSTVFGQVFDDFSDGTFTSDPVWEGDTSDFTISNSSAIPPELKPSLKLEAEGADTSFLVLPNSLINQTEWRFWIKLSFNTSANNYARVYLVSDQIDLASNLNGYFVQLGGSNDSIGLYKQSVNQIDTLIRGQNAFTGNSTNALRVKVTHDNSGHWELFSDTEGGYTFTSEGTAFDYSYTSTAFFGIYCKYTSSNSSKFYFDDFYVDVINVDTIPPEIEFVNVLSASSLEISFTEDIQILSAEEIQNYAVNLGIGHPFTAQRNDSDFTKVFLEFDQGFSPGVAYTLTVTDIEDFAGNVLDEAVTEFEYIIPFPVNPFEILINEIMCDVNPVPVGLPEADYLELYNTTETSVDLKEFTLKPRESANPIVIPEMIIEPDSFLIIVNTSVIDDFVSFGSVLGLSGFSLNNEGLVILKDPGGNLIHAVNYTKEWYRDEDQQEGGWALEQIDPGNPCSGLDNWRAAFSENGGTPGSRNSANGFTFSDPEIFSIDVLSNKSLCIKFTHTMDSASVTGLSAYLVDKGINSPVMAFTDDLIVDQVILEFESEFLINELYELTLTDSLLDCSGKAIHEGNSYSFVLPAEAAPFDVVINEIMADPHPPVGLPEYEYIEIFNTTSNHINVKGWELWVGSVIKPIPDFVIPPDEYIIFTDDDGEFLFSLLGIVVGFSSLGLSNSGVELKLLNNTGEVISAVNYSSSWYGSDEFSEGGYSIEQVDPYYPCAGEKNWMVTMSEKGGTPGQLNSVDAANQLSPEIYKVIVQEENSLEVSFNQMMDSENLFDPMLYNVDNGMGNPNAVQLLDSINSKVLLEFGTEILTRKIYQLDVGSDLKSCVGVPVGGINTFIFGRHEPPLNNDVVINEVLFNPVGDGVDFVEIYNRSGKIFNISDLKLGHVEKDNFGNIDTVFKKIQNGDHLLLPEEYLVLAPDPQKIRDQYFTENPEAFIKMSFFPQYTNEEGTVILASGSGGIIDGMEYHEEMHHPLLTIVDGVSLERINFSRPSIDETNWHSASSQVGFATPGYKNSQYIAQSDLQQNVTIEPEIFSPNNDGYSDVAQINYKFEAAGYMAQIIIFDSNGRPVRYLVNNELLGSEGSFSWDGITEDNQKAGFGIYIVYFEAFDVNGNVKKFKKTVVLGGKI